MPAPSPLAGQTAVITGAASGIGRALAVRLSRAGSPVAIIDADQEGLRDTASYLSGPALVRTVDVRDRQAQMAFASETAEWAPAPIGAVFNNADSIRADHMQFLTPEQVPAVVDSREDLVALV